MQLFLAHTEEEEEVETEKTAEERNDAEAAK